MLRDTLILFNRTMKHITRSADTIITTAVMPICFLLLFVYVFGGALRLSISDHTTYINYLLPGILLMTVASGVSYVGYRLYEDKQKGMFARMKSMPIRPASFLWGHVLTSIIGNFISLIVVFFVAFLLGFRSSAGLVNWLAVLGILLLTILSLTWLMVIPGISAKTMTGSTLLSYPLIFLPFLSSAFVPTDTMPVVVKVFAENQPVTPIVDSIRRLLADQSVGREIWGAMAWLVLIMGISYMVAKYFYKKAI
ncbi:hypothetical protein A5844_001344 [Enterococcus sp. 10A9_DIV0425]|uniref:Transport permease protein n=1 Tax=Candidatus Enterococcus wittei TaxID=1987383 RepID=A0A242K0N2_9ENTE|nr:ABC transporter permease [Enterococcus sp. 10A9_DIV0425]OTP11210.1 hypothetical protein A5844_001344 [Enterococcus sp. 10A9_DIV0425]THE15763.1 ABC transporter permease [Enterococcus hirae]